jgi:hypothetical protein
MSLQIPDPDEEDINGTAGFKGLELALKPISWYSVRRRQSGYNYCEQDESALPYLHLPKNLTNLKFNLNRSHPDDNFEGEEFEEENEERCPKVEQDLFMWIRDMGHLNEKR